MSSFLFSSLRFVVFLRFGRFFFEAMAGLSRHIFRGAFNGERELSTMWACGSQFIWPIGPLAHIYLIAISLFLFYFSTIFSWKFLKFIYSKNFCTNAKLPNNGFRL